VYLRAEGPEPDLETTAEVTAAVGETLQVLLTLGRAAVFLGVEKHRHRWVGVERRLEIVSGEHVRFHVALRADPRVANLLNF